MARWGFVYDQAKCIGCNACQIACKDRHHLEPGKNLRRSDTVCYKENGMTKYAHFSGGCHHCEEPACLAACPFGAMKKTEEGIVVVDEALCRGCGACERACTYGAVFISSQNNKAMKCDGCAELRAQGRQPACVEACVTHCLEFCGITDEETEKTLASELAETFVVNEKKTANKKASQTEVSDSGLIIETSVELADALRKIAGFFASRDQAMELCADFLDWNAHSKREWELEYDFLFRGTDADCEIDLWASVAAGERVLLNQTTLDVIHTYHKYGYHAVRMEGNPDDYIGDQANFLAYLVEAGEMEVVRAFAEKYALPTMKMICDQVKKRGTFEGIVNYLEKSCEVFLAAIKFAGVAECRTALNPPIENENVRIINTAGINNCGGKCVICPEVQDGCMLNISSDFSINNPQIRACVRGRGYRKTFLSPGRLRYPMKRIGERGSGKFERITWEEAADYIASEWIRIRDTYGPSSRHLMYASGVTGIMRPGVLARRLMSLDGGYLDYFNSYSSAAAGYMTPYIFGTRTTGNSPQDILNTKLLILWGDNPVETIFGTERNYYLSKIKERGIRVIVIDPRISNTAITYADQWIGIRPATDSAMADAMAYVIWSEGLQDQAFMDKYCIGFDEEHMPEGIPAGESYKAYLFGEKDGIHKTPEWAEVITGVPAETIRALAREYATAKPACLIMGLGPQRHGNGEQTTKNLCTLACMTGNVGISGGGAAGTTDVKEHEGISLFVNTVKNPYPGKIPVFLWTKAIEHGTEMTPKGDRLTGVEKLDSNIRMVLNLAGNVLINQHSDVNDTIRILKDDTKCQLIVGSDIFMTPSSRFADILLPATSVFEGNNIVAPWLGSNFVLRNNKVIDPLFGCRFEWDWLKEVAERLGLYEEFVEGKPDAEQWLEESYNILRTREPDLPDYETFCKAGGWQYNEQISFIAFKKEIEDPENHPFATPSGKIEIFSKTLYEFEQEDIPAIPCYLPRPEGPEDPLRETYPLQLMGWHTRRRCHSIHDNNEYQDEVEMPGLWIHPKDAAVREIENGDMVEVFNGRGCVRIPAVVTERIVPGVVAMSQGGWFTPDKNGIDTRGSINVLTSTANPTPLAKGNPQHTNLAEVRKCRK
ncbi:MAG: molybdopterin-dependent oxidoreductase [Lachnospiraceae bacterium]|nr:molybdopterin-dependent oxidoreductase [Lachnospiraceae bacterium]